MISKNRCSKKHCYSFQLCKTNRCAYTNLFSNKKVSHISLNFLLILKNLQCMSKLASLMTDLTYKASKLPLNRLKSYSEHTQYLE